MKTQKFEFGNVVLCDFCAQDYTNSTEEGGLLFGSYATCPQCAPKIEADAAKYNETKHITRRANPGQSFADFVRLGLRDGKPGVTTLTTFETGEELRKLMEEHSKWKK